MEKKLSFSEISCVSQNSENGRNYFKLNFIWKDVTKKRDSKLPDEIEFWGIPGNSLVSREYTKYIEEIIYCINHNMIKGYKQPKETYYYPLRYMIKTVPVEVEREIRKWFITGTFSYPEKYEIKEVPVEFKSFMFYDKEKNVLVPIGLFDYMFDTVDEFEKYIDKNFPKKSKISTYYLVNKIAIEIQWHITCFVKSYYKRYLLLEDIGCWPDKLKEIHKIFSFTCPVCKDEHSPAGIAEMPKPFYTLNKGIFLDLVYSGLNIEISDPNVKVDNYAFAKDIFQRICSIENPMTISFARYNKVVTNEVLKKHKYDYQDYVNMAKQLNDNFVMPWEITSERELKSLHDNMIKEFNLRRNTSKQEIKDKYLKLKAEYPKYEISNDKFLIKYPDDIDDLSVEGQSLHHCVGSYKNRVLDKQAIILFLRTCDDCDSPFVTLHIEKKGDHYDLIQAHGVCNCSIKTIDGVYDFVKKWCAQFKIKMENIDRAI